MPGATEMHSTGMLKTQGVSRPNMVLRIEATCTRFRRRQCVGSHATALETIKLMRDVVASAKFSSFEQLCQHVQEIGTLLERAGPKEMVIPNAVRRILKHVREEYAEALSVHLANVESGGTSPTGMETPDSKLPPRHSFRTDSFFDVHPLPESMSTRSLGPTPQRPEGSTMTTMFDLLGHGRGSMARFGAVDQEERGRQMTPCTLDLLHSSSSPPSGSLMSRINTPPRPSSSFDVDVSAAALGFAPPGTPRKSREEAQIEFSSKSFTLKPIFIDAIQELVDEVEHVREEVASYAVEQVHSSECIMTMGHSKTVEAFLKTAARKLKFSVIVAETAPSFSGHTLAASLSNSTGSSAAVAQAIDTLLIPDSAVFALMSRCSKVVIGCHAVLADGSLLAKAGSLNMAMAAKAHLVPVVVVAGMYKFSPDFLGGVDDIRYADLMNPEEVLRMDALGEGTGKVYGDDVEVLNPQYDRVPSELVSLFVTNAGGQPPSLIYRLLTDLYGSG